VGIVEGGEGVGGYWDLSQAKIRVFWDCGLA